MEKLVGREFVIDISQEDIDNSICRQATECAIATSVNRNFGENIFKVGYDKAIVGSYRVSFRNIFVDSIWRFDFTPSDNLCEWMGNFDSGMKVLPIKLKFSIDAAKFSDDLIDFTHKVVT